jgi:Tol biopolymer transport system component
LTSSGTGSLPVWSADGTHIFYSSFPFDKIYQKAANNTGAEELVDTGVRLPADASRDGRYLFMTTPGNSQASMAIWVLPLSGDRKPFPYVQTEFQESQPRLSPDGHWLAYKSNESKRNEIYAVSFPLPGEKWQISTNGGQDPVWSRDGRELYYYSADNKIMAVGIKPSAPATQQSPFGVPKVLFEIPKAANDNGFELSKDGRFLLPAMVEQQTSTPMTVVLNWPDLLKRK